MGANQVNTEGITTHEQNGRTAEVKHEGLRAGSLTSLTGSPSKSIKTSACSSGVVAQARVGAFREIVRAPCLARRDRLVRPSHARGARAYRPGSPIQINKIFHSTTGQDLRREQSLPV